MSTCLSTCSSSRSCARTNEVGSIAWNSAAALCIATKPLKLRFMIAQEGNDELLSQMQQLRCENELLKSRLAQATASSSGNTHETEQLANQTRCQWEAGAHGLSSAEISRYSRQLLLPSFGIEGGCLAVGVRCAKRCQDAWMTHRPPLAAQAQLLRGSVLIIGAGGLGSPAALYLTAAGAGRIGIVDQDVVEVNNLHRQIIHSEARVGMHKAESAAFACQQLNAANKVKHQQPTTAATADSENQKLNCVIQAASGHGEHQPKPLGKSTAHLLQRNPSLLFRLRFTRRLSRHRMRYISCHNTMSCWTAQTMRPVGTSSAMPVWWPASPWSQEQLLVQMVN